jgi:aspartyl-tRNA(Asn)/glutamyl-tRNA(Gln) amidotransferase subunit B
VAELVSMIASRAITGRIAKAVADAMLLSPHLSPAQIVAQNSDYQPIADAGFLEPIVDQVLQENPDSVAAFRAGRDRALAFLVGQVMKLTRGKASPEVVNRLLHQRLSQGRDAP